MKCRTYIKQFPDVMMIQIEPLGLDRLANPILLKEAATIRPGLLGHTVLGILLLRHLILQQVPQDEDID